MALGNDVGDIIVISGGDPRWAYWLEIEITANDGDPDDPQWTEFKPRRYAYRVDPGVQIWSKQVDRLLGTETTDDLDPVWNDVPNRFKNKTYSSASFYAVVP